jgi:hypothetical protein
MPGKGVRGLSGTPALTGREFAMRVRARWSVFGLLVLFSAAGAQEATQAQRYVIPGHGSLSLNVPRAWMALSKPLETPPSVVLLFRPASGGAFSVQLTSAWLAPDKLAGFTPESIRSKTQDSATKLLPEAEEKEAAVAELRGTESIGYYFSLTSRGAPSGPEDYKYMTQGTVRTGEFVTTFTILHRDPVLAEKAQALRMLADATRSSEPSAATTLQIRESAKSYELTVPAGRPDPREQPVRRSREQPRVFLFRRSQGVPEPLRLVRATAEIHERQGIVGERDQGVGPPGFAAAEGRVVRENRQLADRRLRHAEPHRLERAHAGALGAGGDLDRDAYIDHEQEHQRGVAGEDDGDAQGGTGEGEMKRSVQGEVTWNGAESSRPPQPPRRLGEEQRGTPSMDGAVRPVVRAFAEPSKIIEQWNR